MTDRTAVALVVAGMTLAVGCSDKERLSAEEFRERANAICVEGAERVEAKVNDLIGDNTEVPSDEQLDELADVVADDFDDQIHEIRGLGPPEDLEDDVDAALDSAEEAVHELEERGAEAFQSDDDPFDDTNALLTDLGLTDCAS